MSSLSRIALLAALAAVVGCDDASDGDKSDTAADAGSTEPDGGDVEDDGEDSGEGESDGDDGSTELEAPTYSQGSCPTFVDGPNEGFVHAHGSHDLTLILPPEPAGAPVLYAWHWLGGSARQIVNAMELESLAEREGVIVVAPDSAGSPYEWEFISSPVDNPDLALFVDSLACLSEQYEVDLSRVWTTGMSAGGLWTTYLTMHESRWLAASAPLSGGTFPGSYSTPEATLPVMVTWGGPDDTYGSDVNFEETSLDFSGRLQEDGHFVVECVHTRGHTLPPDATELVWSFLSVHAKDQPSPWADGLPEALPDWCRLP